MDKYTVKLYSRAIRDLDQIYLYISTDLLAPDAAADTVDMIEQAIFSLEEAPERGSQRKTGSFAHLGYRQIFAGNYVIIYKVLRDKKEVHVVTVRYVKSHF